MILTLFDRRPERIQLRELSALVVGKQQAHWFEALGESICDPLAQSVDAVSGQRRDLHGLG